MPIENPLNKNSDEPNFIASISHDLRNYIGGISGLANIISENIASYKAKQEMNGDILDENLKEIAECANMLAPYSNEALHYVNDLLNSAQNKTGKFTLGVVSDCDFGEIIKELLIFNKSFIEDNKIFIETDIEENLPILKCDVHRLKQILINLITNAVKYSNAGNKVKISIKFLNKNIQIEIVDHGIGMTQEEIKMALSGKGHNIDKSTFNKPIDSCGLGMPIIKQLVELMEANMEIESEKGNGTRVSLYFSCNN